MPIQQGKENRAKELQSQIDFFKQMRDDHGADEVFEDRQFSLTELNKMIAKLEGALAAMAA